VLDGWNMTGDYVYLDDEGYVFFVSRETDLIKSSGYRIGPGEIEDALVRHPAVKDAGVIGVPDPIRGENVKAFISLNENYIFDEDLHQEILSFLRDKIAIYKLPRVFEVLKEIPRTPAGKIVRRTLHEIENAN
jgi:2-aminobenzoate-CoA ligase